MEETIHPVSTYTEKPSSTVEVAPFSLFHDDSGVEIIDIELCDGRQRRRREVCVLVFVVAMVAVVGTVAGVVGGVVGGMNQEAHS